MNHKLHHRDRCDVTIHKRRRISSRERESSYLEIWKQYQKGCLWRVLLSPFRRIAQERSARLPSFAKECRSARKKTIASLAEARRPGIVDRFAIRIDEYFVISASFFPRIFHYLACTPRDCTCYQCAPVLINMWHTIASCESCVTQLQFYNCSNAVIIIETFQRI